MCISFIVTAILMLMSICCFEQLHIWQGLALMLGAFVTVAPVLMLQEEVQL